MAHLLQIMDVEVRDQPFDHQDRGQHDRSAADRARRTLEHDAKMFRASLEATERSDRLIDRAGSSIHPGRRMILIGQNMVRSEAAQRSLSLIEKAQRLDRIRRQHARLMEGR